MVTTEVAVLDGALLDVLTLAVEVVELVAVVLDVVAVLVGSDFLVLMIAFSLPLYMAAIIAATSKLSVAGLE